MSKKSTQTIARGITLLLIATLVLVVMPASPTFAADTGFSQPTLNHNGGGNNDWINPQNAYVADGLYTTAIKNGRIVQYYGFTFAAIQTGYVIDGIEVVVEGLTTGGQALVDLSADSGATFTTGTGTGVKTTTFTTSDAVLTLGGPTDLWGTAHTWVSGDFGGTPNTNFRVRLASTAVT